MPIVAGPITPGGDAYPAVDESHVAGGAKSVADLTARDAILDSRRKAGMTVRVLSTGKDYRLSGSVGAWVWKEVVGTFDSYTFVVLPDTRYWTASASAAVANFLVALSSQESVAFILHAGDVVDEASNSTQWADIHGNLFPPIENIPHLVVPGDRDYGALATRSASEYNARFTNQYYTGKLWWSGGFYSGASTENLYLDVDAGSTKWRLIGLEFAPRDAALTWAAARASEVPNRRVLIVTHDYLWTSGRRKSAVEGISHPSTYGLANWNDGQQCWERTFRTMPNLVAVFNGHNLEAYREDGRLRSVDWGDYGNPVQQVMACYSTEVDGNWNTGKPWVRIYRAMGNLVRCTTYDPLNNAFLATRLHQFTLNMGVPRPGSPADPALQEGLVNHFAFSEGDGTGTRDLVTGEWGELMRTGTRQSPGWGEGITGRCVTFGGVKTDGHAGVRFPNVTDAELYHAGGGSGDALSISVWFKQAVAGVTDAMLVSKMTGGAADGSYALRRIGANGLLFTVINNNSVRTDFTVVEALGDVTQWNHVLATWSAADGVMELFVNGTSVGTKAATQAPLHKYSMFIEVGMFLASATWEFDLIGSLDEVMIWRRRLDARQIRLLQVRPSNDLVAAAPVDAPVGHALAPQYDDVEVEAALNGLSWKVNATATAVNQILAALKDHGLIKRT